MLLKSDIVHIDQSGKVNKTNDDTAIVCCSPKSYEYRNSIFVPKRVTAMLHSRLKNDFKRDNRVRWFGPKLFAVSLYYLLEEDIGDVRQVVVEREYPGNMPDIFNAVCSWFRAEGYSVEVDMFNVQPREVNQKAHMLAKNILARREDARIELDYYDFERMM